MIKKGFLLVVLIGSILTGFAQNGTIKGHVKDAKTGEALVGTTVFIEGTTIGTITDFDGNYLLPNAPAGTHTLVCSFISYETVKKDDITVQPGNNKVVDFELGEASIAVEEVNVVVKVNRESENILLLDQKKASVIKESIGAKRLSALGVSDAAAATTKITGVTKNEGSGDVYIRGLGDRYLSTTMNGLPIPSDDVEKKNIDLNLFSTEIIESVGINKTFSVDAYGDQSSGTVNINSKTDSEKITIGISSGSNTTIISDGRFGNYKATQNYADINNFGVYDKPYSTVDAIKPTKLEHPEK